MSRRVVGCVVLCGIVAGAGIVRASRAAAPVAPTIAFVNMQRVATSTEEGKKINSELRAELTLKQKQYAEAKTAADKVKDPKEKKEKQSAADALGARLQKEWDAKSERVSAELKDVVVQAVRAVSERKRMLVLPTSAAPYVPAELDITDEVVAEAERAATPRAAELQRLKSEIVEELKKGK